MNRFRIGRTASSRTEFRTLGSALLSFVRSVSGTNSNFGRNVSNWLNKKKVYPHNVKVFEEEHYNNHSNVLEFPTACNNKLHSAAFPLELPIWFIKLFTRGNNIVLDPFMGSGTTAIASILLGRKFLGIEIVEEYVKLSRINIKNAMQLLENK